MLFGLRPNKICFYFSKISKLNFRITKFIFLILNLVKHTCQFFYSTIFIPCRNLTRFFLFSTVSGWETATRKGGPRRILHVTPIDSRDATPSDQHRVSMDPKIVAEKITEETGQILSVSATSDMEIGQEDTTTDGGDLINSTISAPAPSGENTENNDGIESQTSVSVSLPASRKSTLKRNNRKKRASLDSSENKTGSGSGSGSTSSSILSKPVLISDRDFDVASAIAAQRRCNKSAFEVLDESKIRDMVNNSTAAAATHPNAGAVTNAGVKTTFDTLYISDIGYGMSGGPISMGRFGLGKYMPPDRSNEILPLEQSTAEKIVETNESVTENEENCNSDNAGDKTSIIKAMMDQVIRTSSGCGNGKNNDSLSATVPSSCVTGNTISGTGSSLTYIRDAERFTELTVGGDAGSKIAQSNIIPTGMSTKTTTTSMIKENNAILKSQELDLD